jgi:DNA-binding NtrC family response regulator
VESVEGKTGPARILIIDDEPVIRDMLHDVLSCRGFVVNTAEDAKSGLMTATSTPHDVIFTDIRMPGMNGLEVCRQLRHICPESRIIMMTGYGLEEMIQEALTLGAFASVKKPFDIQDIYDLVDRALGSIQHEKGKPSQDQRRPEDEDNTRDD